MITYAVSKLMIYSLLQMQLPMTLTSTPVILVQQQVGQVLLVILLLQKIFGLSYQQIQLKSLQFFLWILVTYIGQEKL